MTKHGLKWPQWTLFGPEMSNILPKIGKFVRVFGKVGIFSEKVKIGVEMRQENNCLLKSVSLKIERREQRELQRRKT